MGNSRLTQCMMPLLAGLCILLGCRDSAPQLKYVEIGVDENKATPIFGITLENTGDTPVTILKCVPEILSTHVFALDSGPVRLPEKFEFHVELWKTQQGLTIAPGDEAMIPVIFAWDLPEDAPNLIALCSSRLYLQSDAASDIPSEKVMFFVRGEGVSSDMLRSDPIDIDRVKDPAEILHAIETFEGRKSSAVLEFRDNLREWMGQGV